MFRHGCTAHGVHHEQCAIPKLESIGELHDTIYLYILQRNRRADPFQRIFPSVVNFVDLKDG